LSPKSTIIKNINLQNFISFLYIFKQGLEKIERETENERERERERQRERDLVVGTKDLSDSLLYIEKIMKNNFELFYGNKFFSNLS
jgi:hypothetical protein